MKKKQDAVLKQDTPRPCPDYTTTDRQKRMERIVAKFQHYVETYSYQIGYNDYSDGCFIDDMIYGIGIAINEDENQYMRGFDKFKQELKKRIEKGQVH